MPFAALACHDSLGTREYRGKPSGRDAGRLVLRPGARVLHIRTARYRHLSSLHLVRRASLGQVDDAKEDVHRRARLPFAPAAQVVDIDVEDQGERGVAFEIIDQARDGADVQFSVHGASSVLRALFATNYTAAFLRVWQAPCGVEPTLLPACVAAPRRRDALESKHGGTRDLQRLRLTLVLSQYRAY